MSRADLKLLAEESKARALRRGSWSLKKNVFGRLFPCSSLVVLGPLGDVLHHFSFIELLTSLLEQLKLFYPHSLNFFCSFVVGFLQLTRNVMLLEGPLDSFLKS